MNYFLSSCLRLWKILAQQSKVEQATSSSVYANTAQLARRAPGFCFISVMLVGQSPRETRFHTTSRGQPLRRRKMASHFRQQSPGSCRTPHQAPQTCLPGGPGSDSQHVPAVLTISDSANGVCLFFGETSTVIGSRALPAIFTQVHYGHVKGLQGENTSQRSDSVN